MTRSRPLLLGMAALFATTAAGCFGQFRAVHAVYDFNRQASDSAVVRSLLQVALIVVPVYLVAALVDMLVLHVLDFVNGTNPVATETLPDGSALHMARIDGRTVRVRHVDSQGRESSFELVRGADGRLVQRAVTR